MTTHAPEQAAQAAEQDPHVALPANFTIDRSLPPAVALSALPFVNDGELQRMYGQPATTQTVAFPVERIISNARGVDWSGEGAVKSLENGATVSSFDYAQAMGRNRVYASGRTAKPISLSLFQDARGEVWGKVHDGTHRVMGAKFEGERTIIADVDVPDDPVAMDYYPGDVVAEQTARASNTVPLARTGRGRHAAPRRSFFERIIAG